MANDQVAKIRAALAQLDPTNNDHWTDDGLPKTGVVQRIANDQTIKRQDIQAAQPGFERPAVVTAPPTISDFGEPIDTAPKADAGAPAAAVAAATDADAEVEYLTDDQVFGILQKRCDDAEAELTAARKQIVDGQAREKAAMLAVVETKAELVRNFPPLTAAENVKQYIASEQAKRAARVESRRYPGSQVDASMQRGNSRGWRRPVRGVMGADGSLIKGADGQVIMPRPMQARPMPAGGIRA
jgi:hypothetical protein